MTTLNCTVCKICGHATTRYGDGIYYLEDGNKFPVPFCYCRNCNTFFRQVNEKSVISHLKAASHTSIQNEEKYYKMRIGFFKYLYSLTQKHTDSFTNWLDFGCSYGHLLEYLKGRKIDCFGIEISEEVRTYAQNKGLVIFENIDDFPVEKKFDVISLIDSIYYSNEPVDLIKRIYSRLQPDGLIIVRITNRNWLAKVKKNLLRREPGLALGDATNRWILKNAFSIC